MTKNEIEAWVRDFWQSVRIRGENDCWNWKYPLRNGYGVWSGKPASRVAWMLANGRVAPKGMFVCHTCDNKACCNPRHLYLGTPADNSQDMVERGRTRRGKITHSGKQLRVAVLRLIGTLPQRDIARRFGVSESYISRIKSGDRLNGT